MRHTDQDIKDLPTRYAHHKSHLPYNIAKQAINSLAPEVTSANKYRKWIKETKSYYMPIHPERVYPDFTWPDFLNTKNVSIIVRVAEHRRRKALYRPLWDAIRWSQRYCRKHSILTKTQWLAQYKEDKTIPEDIPLNPQIIYKKAGYPGFEVWCGKNPSALQEAAQRVTPILTLVHPAKVPQNVVQLLIWPDGIGELREKWVKQSSFDRIIGCWVLERDLMPTVERILSDFGHFDGERYTIPILHQVTWELNSLLEMIRL